jgi:hypothetical protein
MAAIRCINIEFFEYSFGLPRGNVARRQHSAAVDVCRALVDQNEIRSRRTDCITLRA